MQVFQVVDFSILELYNIDARSEDSATLGSDMSAIGNLYRMGLFIRPIFAAGKKHPGKAKAINPGAWGWPHKLHLSQCFFMK